MSSPPIRQPKIWLVRQRNDMPVVEPSTNLDFMTQEARARSVISRSVVTDTPAKTSARRYSTVSQTAQIVAPTEAPPSHHPEEHNDRIGNHEQSQSIRDTSIPLTKDCNAVPSQIKVEAGSEWPAAGHPPALEDFPMHELYAVVLRLLNKGIPLEVLHKEVDQAAASHSRDPNHVQRDPTSPERRTSGPIVETIEQDPTVEKYASALAADKLRKPQCAKLSPLQDTAGSRLLDKADPTSKTPSGLSSGPLIDAHRERSVSATLSETSSSWDFLHWDNFSDSEEDKAHTASMNQKVKRDRAVKNEDEFLHAFPHWLFDKRFSREADVMPLSLASDTVEDNRKNQGRMTTDQDTWQIMYNIVANVLCLGMNHLQEVVNAISRPSGDDIRAAKSSRPGTVHQAVATHGVFEVSGDENEFESFKDAMCSWATEREESPLIWVYSYHDKLRTVRQYDKWTKPENEKQTKELLKKHGHYLGSGERGVSGAVLRYICEEQQLRKEDIPAKVKSLRSEINRIRTVCALVDVFGEGVLVLLGKNPQNLINQLGAKGNNAKHRRLQEVAISLAKSDRRKHHGKLCKLFSDVREKVVKPALQFREHGNTEGWLMDRRIQKGYFKTLVPYKPGEGLSWILDQIKKVNVGSDDTAAQGGQESLKRGMPHNITEEAADGGPHMNKRIKTELAEHEELGEDD